MNNKIVTIFTPTYNRAHLLVNLYHALLRQTNKNFIWLIVDDGSTDNTGDIVKNWIEEKIIDIEYYYQKNAGKMSAHNFAVQHSQTPLFLDIDSDDLPTSDCVEKILSNAEYVLSSNELYALAAAYGKGYRQPIADKEHFYAGKIARLSDLADEGYRGETTIVFKTDIIKNYLFPIIQGEKFIPEGYIYMIIEQKYKLYIIDGPIVYGEYQLDGYSHQFLKLIKNNPNSFAIYHRQRYEITNEKKYLIRCLTYHMIGNKRNIIEDIKRHHISIVYLIPALVLSVKRKFQFKKAGL